MAQLSGIRVLVAGGTGEVGEGLVRQLLAARVAVIVPVRSPEKGERLKATFRYNDSLSFVQGDVGDPDDAARVAKAASATGNLDAVVASIGGWWQGQKLAEVSAETWNTVLANNLTPHFLVARSFVPLLSERGGTFIQINGGAAEFPIPGSSLISIAAAALAMMGRVLAAEAPANVSVRQLQINSLVATRSRLPPQPDWLTADEVGQAVCALIAAPGAELTIRLHKNPTPKE